MKTASIRAIAKAAGVSPATAYRALHHGFANRVSPETCARVIAAAKKLRYCSERESRLYGILVAELTSSYAQQLIEELLSQIHAQNHRCVIIPEQGASAIETMWLDGLISNVYYTGLDVKYADAFNLPIVTINNFSRRIDNIFSVNSDDSDAIEQAVNHLVKLGHRQIGLLHQDPTNNMCSRIRLQSYIRVMKERYNLKHCEWDFAGEPLTPIIREIAAAGVTGLIVASEGNDLKLLNSLAENHLRVPEDMSLIVWGSSGFSESVHPRLTALRQNFKALAAETLNMLDNLIAGRAKTLTNIEVPYLFFPRESTGVPR